MNKHRIGTKATRHPYSNMLWAVGLSAIASTLAGCGGVMPGTKSEAAATPAVITITGAVHGGQQPVNGAIIQMYTVGTSGLQSPSQPMLTQVVKTDPTGNFVLTTKYNCATIPATQVYITATGGDPGVGGPNSALSLGVAMGLCTNLTPATYVQMNELTTVAMAYALAPFAKDYTDIGAQGSNPTGLVNAFANAAMLVNNLTGLPPGAGLASGVSVPATELNTIADIISSCVNTAGPSNAYCVSLFAGTGASNTFDAALAMAKNPGSSGVIGLYALAGAAPPFLPVLNSAPRDFSVAVTSTAGGGLATPYGIAIDGSGNAWVTNASGTSVSEIGPTGSLVATTTGLSGPQGVAVDRSGNVWVANTAGNSVVKYTLTAGAVTATNAFTANVSAPTAIALDSASNAFATNFNGNSVVGMTSAGVALSGSPFTGSGNITKPTGVAVGPTGTLYVTSSNGSVVNLTNAGAYSSTLTDNALQGPVAVAVDGTGRVLETGFTTGGSVTGAMSVFSAGTPLATSPYSFGNFNPAGVASDGTSIWVANNQLSGTLAQYSYTSGTPVSSNNGFGSLVSPVGVAIDSSGSVWTTNSAGNSVTKFIGMAAPVATPLAVNVGP